MLFTFLIAFISLIGLIILHELGHFILAKRFGIEVEEFGIGYPPRLFGKKFGETLYSLNLLPFGAFVKIHGEEGGIEDYRSFTGKPIWQRIAIVLGGVVSFWIIAAVLLSIVAGVWGLPTMVEDDENYGLVNPKVQTVLIFPDTPAQTADLKIGDIISSVSYQQTEVNITKVKEVQEFVDSHKGEEITLTIKRGTEVLEKKITPRISYPEDQKPLGIGLVRTALKIYPWYQAPWQGTLMTWNLTANIVGGWVMAIESALGISELPEGVEMDLRGPLGIFDLLSEYFQLGINYFLYLVALISVALALVNILPIPALDGGKIIFLLIETVRGKPINPKAEQNITAAFFFLLIFLLIFVTVKFDIPRFF